MTEITICPDCNRKLKVPDNLLGTKVRCPGCNLPFIAQAGLGLHELVEVPDSARERATSRRSEGYSECRSEPPSHPERDDDRRPRPRDEDDYDDRRPSRRDDEYDDDYPRRRPTNSMKALRGVRLGLRFVIIAGWITIGMIGFGAIGFGVLILAGVSILGSSTPGQAFGGIAAAGVGLIFFFGMLGLLGLAEVVLRLVGYGMCIQVPVRRNGAVKGLVIAALCCAAAATLLNFSGAAVGGGGGRGGMAYSAAGYGGSTYGSLAGFLAMAGYVCWLLFLRSLALQYRDEDVASRLMSCLIGWIVFGVVGFIVTCIVVFAGMATVFRAIGARSVGQSLGFFAVFAFIMFGLLGLCWLALYVRYLLLVVEVRGIVDNELERRRP